MGIAGIKFHMTIDLLGKATSRCLLPQKRGYIIEILCWMSGRRIIQYVGHIQNEKEERRCQYEGPLNIRGHCCHTSGFVVPVVVLILQWSLAAAKSVLQWRRKRERQTVIVAVSLSDRGGWMSYILRTSVRSHYTTLNMGTTYPFSAREQ